MPGRRALRNFLDKLMVEFTVIGIVMVYMMLIFIDLMLNDDENIKAKWNPVFMIIDLAFLCAFTFELSLRLYAYGMVYLRSALSVFDALVVLVSFAMQILVVSSSKGIGNDLTFLSALRMIRLLRLFVILNKVQNTRERRKKEKYMKLGAPVERVMTLLDELKTNEIGLASSEIQTVEEQQADLTWIMQLIASDKLYTIDLRTAAGGKMSSDMAAFLTANMGMKKETVGDDADTDATGVDDSSVTSLSQAEGLKRQESGYVSQGGVQELELMEEIVENPAMTAALAKLHDWDFDPFEFHELTRQSGLVVGVYQLFCHYGLIDKFRLSKHRLLVFFRKIQDGYKATNPYHNCIHALDVVLNANYFMRHTKIKELITPLDILAVILASAIHDHEHPGLNNNFLMATKHEYAIRYNDQSVLESHHIASSWRLLLQDDYNFLRALSRDQYIELRDTVIQLVLGTDMKFHFEHFTKFKTKCSSDAFVPGCERSDVKFLLSIAVHTGDIANPAKPQSMCLRWTELVMEEFFRQGDLENEMGLPISPFYDRHKTSTAQCQMGFINVLVKPLFSEVSKLLGEPALTDCLGAVQANLEGWEAHGNNYFKLAGKD